MYDALGSHSRTLETIRMLAGFTDCHVALTFEMTETLNILEASPSEDDPQVYATIRNILQNELPGLVPEEEWYDIQNEKTIKPFHFGQFFVFPSTDPSIRSRLCLLRKHKPAWNNHHRLLIEQTRENIQQQLNSEKTSRESIEQQPSSEESQKRLNLLINATPDVICFKDPNGRWMEANEAIRQLFRLKDQEILFRNEQDLKKMVPELSEVFEKCRQSDLKAWQEKQPITVEEIIPQSNGDERILDVIKTPVFNEKGDREGLVVLGRDITARKKTEELLRESEERFRNIATHTNDIIFEWIPEKDQLLWLGEANNLTPAEQPPSSLAGFAPYIHDDDRYRIIHFWRNLFQEEVEWTDEFRICHGHTDTRYFRAKGVMLFKNNKPYKAVGTFTDVTQEKNLINNLKKAAEEAEYNQARITGLLSVIPDMLFVFDKNGTIIDYHAPENHLLFTAPENFIDSRVDEILPEDIARLTHQKIWSTQHHKKVETYEYQLTINNQDHIFESRMVFVDDDRYLSIVRDITPARRIEQELREAKEQAEESDRLKSAFLANLSHEIRTPMNGILGFSELLKNQNLPEEDRQNSLDLIIKSGQQLLAIINDVLDLSRLETGQISLIRDKVNLTRLISDLARFFAMEASERSVELREEIPEENYFAWVDGGKITQIFNNLLSNAFKFTSPGGHIVFGFEPRPHELLFFVHDDGIGIAPRHHALIFERFGQVLKVGGKNKGGTGLGLSICQSLLNLMDGEIWVESKAGKGASFFFTVPYSSAEAH